MPRNEDHLDLHQRRSRQKRQLSISLIMVMWFLGLIEWSDPSMDCTPDELLPPLTVVKSLWKRQILSLTSRVYLCALIIQNLCCGGFYIKHYFGEVKRFYRFASYLVSFWSLMIAVQIVCLITSFRRQIFNVCCVNINNQWWTVLTERSISQRFHPFDLSTVRPPKSKTLLLFCLCASACIGFEVTHFYYNARDSKHDMELHNYLQVSSGVHNIWFFSIFCYFLYIQRIALQVHFDSFIWFARKHVGEFDVCQAKLKGCFNDYIQIRRLVHPLITFVISATAFGLIVHIAWNYDVMDDGLTKPNKTSMPITKPLTNITEGEKLDFNVLNILILVEKLVVLLLALFAAGGSDVSYIWERCHLTINIMYTSRRDKFWRKLSKTMHHLHINTKEDDNIIDLLPKLLLIAIAVVSFAKFGF